MKEFYQSLKGLPLPSCYKVAVITRACAILKSREKSKKRGVLLQHRRPLRPMVCLISGFFISAKGRLFIPLKRDDYADVQLDRYVLDKLAGKETRSLTITSDSLSFCYSTEVEPSPVHTVFGVDRNEKNLTYGNHQKVVQVDLSKTVRIRQTTREIISSFRRNDARIRKKLAARYWRRANNRNKQMLHAAANYIITSALDNGAALASKT